MAQVLSECTALTSFPPTGAPPRIAVMRLSTEVHEEERLPAREPIKRESSSSKRQAKPSVFKYSIRS
jgi:hypothetical protein